MALKLYEISRQLYDIHKTSYCESHEFLLQAIFVQAHLLASLSFRLLPNEIQYLLRCILMIDLDRSTFKSERALRLALTRTLQNIKSILAFTNYENEPTIIWSGNGYHIYLILDSQGITLENIKEFSDLSQANQISVKFLRFIEWFLSSGKSDRAHNTTVSFNNCMLRIPGSFNSKNNAQIWIVSRKNTPATPAISSIKPLLRDFRRYLLDQYLIEQRRLQQHHQRQYQRQQCQERRPLLLHYSSSINTISWIEKLLHTPLPDFRKYCIWRILTPYLLNVKRLSVQEASDIIKEWLDKCDELNRLDFKASVNQRIKDSLKGAAKKGYLPISLDKLKQENPALMIIVGRLD
jgi:hypothetical protein